MWILHTQNNKNISMIIKPREFYTVEMVFNKGSLWFPEDFCHLEILLVSWLNESHSQNLLDEEDCYISCGVQTSTTPNHNWVLTDINSAMVEKSRISLHNVLFRILLKNMGKKEKRRNCYEKHRREIKIVSPCWHSKLTWQVTSNEAHYTSDTNLEALELVMLWFQWLSLLSETNKQ